jgi:hypothetical protein
VLMQQLEKKGRVVIRSARIDYASEVVATRVKHVSNNTQPEDKKKAKVTVIESQTSSVFAGAMCPALKQPNIVFSGSISYSIALIEDRIISEDNEGTILDGKAIKSVPNQSGTQEGPGKRHLSQDQTLQSGNASCRREEQHGPMIDL